MLNSVTEEKEGCAERCKQLLDRERAEAEERELALRREFTEKLGELEEQYNGLREHVEQGAMGSMGEEEQSGAENEKLWEEIESLRAERAELEAKAKVGTGERGQIETKMGENWDKLRQKWGKLRQKWDN